jgi:TolA-binding protein
MNELLVTALSGLLTLIGVCVTAWASAKKTRDQVADRLRVAQAVTDTKLDDLSREVRAHNDFASRIPVLEEQIKVINHRIADLEKGGS